MVCGIIWTRLETLAVSETMQCIVHNLSTEKDAPCRFDDVLEDDKSKVKPVLFFLDKFHVGDSFYHEFSMEDDELPRSYLIKQRRGQLNNICHMSSTPGMRKVPKCLEKYLLNELGIML